MRTLLFVLCSLVLGNVPESRGGKEVERTVLRTARDCIMLLTGAKPGDEVSVYYTGKLAANGKQFDSNEGGEPLNFRLGDGRVIEGWEKGLKGTCEGETVNLKIPADFAYGTRGAGNGLIPANSDLVFNITLVKLTKALHKADLVKVACSKSAQSRDKDVVTFDYVGRLPDGRVFNSGNNVTAEIGKTGIEGWDESLTGLCEGSSRRAAIPPELAYGEKGVDDLIPPNTIIVVDITLNKIQDRTISFLQRISSGTFGGR